MDDTEDIATEAYIENCMLDIIRHCSCGKAGIQTRTPARAVKYLEELLSGYNQDPVKELGTPFKDSAAYQGSVYIDDIHFTSMCAHHMAPFFGTVCIRYTPAGGLIGLSKFARLTQCLSRRLQVQEILGREIAETIIGSGAATSVSVGIIATHTCMTARGIKSHGATTMTTINLHYKQYPIFNIEGDNLEQRIAQYSNPDFTNYMASKRGN